VAVVAPRVPTLGQLLPRARVPASARAPAPELPRRRTRVLAHRLGLLGLLGIHGVLLVARDLHDARGLSLLLG
jgi:hypothetical protein